MAHECPSWSKVENQLSALQRESSLNTLSHDEGAVLHPKLLGECHVNTAYLNLLIKLHLHMIWSQFTFIPHIKYMWSSMILHSTFRLN